LPYDYNLQIPRAGLPAPGGLDGLDQAEAIAKLTGNNKKLSKI